MKICGIYKITSIVGKIYIGQSINIMYRWEKYYQKLRCKQQIKLYNSLKKYGSENHTFEIIEECQVELLDEKEIYWGNFYNVLSDDGLNLRLGSGRGACSQETKDKMSNSRKGLLLGIPKSEEHRDNIKKGINSMDLKQKQQQSLRMSVSRKGVPKSESHKLNMKIGRDNMSLEDKTLQRKKQSNSTKGKPKPEGFGINIALKNKGKIRNDVSRNNIKDGLNNMSNINKENRNLNISNSKKGKILKKKWKITLQYSKEGDFIKEWESQKLIQSELGINQSDISSCCTGKIKSAGGYIWKYKIDNYPLEV